jgi:hypothetical protein
MLNAADEIDRLRGVERQLTEALDQTIRLGNDLRIERDRLRALLDGRTMSCSQCEAMAERLAAMDEARQAQRRYVVTLESEVDRQLSDENATLRALLAETNAALDVCDLTTADEGLVHPIQERIRIALGEDR